MKRLMKGNDAIVHGALLGGATHFFGYPITPASEVAHAAAYYFTKSGRHFLQAESEVSAINMLFGAGAAGARVMTASSSPGIALMSEGISYIAGSQVPCVIVNVQRAGPGLGNIWPEQGDYNMVVKGGGNGCYKCIVLAPNSAQEMADCSYKAFGLADKYRVPVFILSDAYIGQMMEAVSFPTRVKEAKRNDWAIYADGKSRKSWVKSILMNQNQQQEYNILLQNIYKEIEDNEQDSENYHTEDAEIVLSAFGICSRICLTVVRELRKEGIKIGLFRPKTLFPFPNRELNKAVDNAKKMIVVELNNGQMSADIQLGIKNRIPVINCNWYGGYVPTVNEVIEKIKKDI
ncbi:MAG: 3-methyl-2-oxobutanoate dehydrogenase subunit VorB [Victivallales bacterium]|nr:3-methyl-2-oxobutanoate dehydrogenase subunit VorB [Victivallales bacterium]